MAQTVQNPGEPIGIALAFKGKPGTGKSRFATWLGKLFGVHFLHLDSEDRLTGRFNAQLHEAILVLADEAVWAGGKAGLGALKRMITEDTLAIERKGIDTINLKNLLHMVIASNEDWFVPVGWDDRPFAVFEVSDEHCNDVAFFGKVYRQLFEQDGLAALLYDLLEHECGRNADLRDIPETEARMSQKMFSSSIKEEWWMEMLLAGRLVGASTAEYHEGTPTWAKKIEKDDVVELFGRFLKDHHRSSRSEHATRTLVGMFLHKYTLLEDSKEDGERYWDVPTLEACRSDWAMRKGIPAGFKWPRLPATPTPEKKLSSLIDDPPF